MWNEAVVRVPVCGELTQCTTFAASLLYAKRIVRPSSWELHIQPVSKRVILSISENLLSVRKRSDQEQVGLHSVHRHFV